MFDHSHLPNIGLTNGKIPPNIYQALNKEIVDIYNDDSTVSSFQIISDNGLEIWDYSYNKEGRLDKESYHRKGALVRISFFPNERKRVDELYRADEIFLRVTWFDNVKIREEVINNGKIIRVRDFSDGDISGIKQNDDSS